MWLSAWNLSVALLCAASLVPYTASLLLLSRNTPLLALCALAGLVVTGLLAYVVYSTLPAYLLVALLPDAVLACVLALRQQPEAPQAGIQLLKRHHDRSVSSWSSSLLPTRRESVIDFSGYSTPSNHQDSNPHSVPQSPSAGSGFWVQALYDFNAGDARNELAFKKGQYLRVVDWRGNWWRASVAGGTAAPQLKEVGFIPSNYVQVLRKARVLAQLQSTGGQAGQSGARPSLLPRPHAVPTTFWLDVKPGQLVEVLQMDPKLDHHEAEVEEEWVVRGVDARIGVVPSWWLQLVSAGELPALGRE